MPAWLAALIAEVCAAVVSQTVRALLDDLPAIAAAWRLANSRTVTDASQAPKEVVDAINAQLRSVDAGPVR